MKNILFRLIGYIGFSALVCTIHAQWTPTGGPRGGDIDLLVAHGDTVIARSGCRPVYISTDNGESWSAMESELPDGGCPTSFAISVSGIFAGRRMGGGMYRTDDKGKNWTPIMSGLPDTAIYAIAANDSTVFIATLTGIFRSTDNGSTWNAAVSGLPDNLNMVASCLTANGSSVFAGTQSGYFRSTDNGVTWSAINFPDNLSIYSLAINGTTLFARTYRGVYRSSDNGSSWSSVNFGLEDSVGLKHLAMSGTTVFVGSLLNFYRSMDSGKTLTALDYGPTTSYLTALAANGTTVFIGTRGAGIFRSTDNGTNWNASDSGINYLPIPALAAIGSTIFAGSNGGVFRRARNGASWTPENLGGTFEFLSSLAATGNALYAGTNKCLYCLKDSGFTWTKGDNLPIESLVASGSYCIASRTYSTNDHGTLLFYGNLYRSGDDGASWTNVLLDFSAQRVSLIAMGTKILAVGSLIHNNEHIQRSTVYHSTDTGATWKTLGSTGPIISLAVIDSLMFAGTYRCENSTQCARVLVSTDSGVTWSPSDSGLSGNTNVNTLAVHGGTVFAGTSSGIYFSTNRGKSWQPATDGFPAGDTVLSFTACDSTVYAGTSHSGIWRKTIPGSMVMLNDTPLGELLRRTAFSMGISTRSGRTAIIDFTLPASKRVTVNIYDLSGSKIATIIDNYLKKGTHRLFWDTHTIANGFYTLRLIAGSRTVTKSIPVLR
jgi:photosystem II stability/assembly factor-like uncharacterized protein